MRIQLKKIAVQEVVWYDKKSRKCTGFKDDEDDGDGGVYGMGGRLNIRPAYQRGFIYKNKDRDAVIRTIINNFPLNAMYWVENKDGSYEVLDGQQRLISIGRYVLNNFSVMCHLHESPLTFENLPEDLKDRILNYKLMVYFCEGTHSEKLDWFRTINIAGKELSDQELRNAIFSGPWVTDAKRYFSRKNGPSVQVAGLYLDNSNIDRQSHLETAIDWISNGKIDEYMSAMQYKESAAELWDYFVTVIKWVESVFPPGARRPQMRGVEFGLLFNKYKDNKYDPAEVEKEVTRLMQDEDVTNKKGIYKYIFTRDEKDLNIRAFSEYQKITAYEKQGGLCVKCGKKYDFLEMQADHILPWSKGGKTIAENCQVLCKQCNRRKSDM